MKTTALIYLKKKNIINRIAVISILFIHFILFPSYSIQNLNHKTYSSQKDYYTVPLLFNSTSEHLDNFNYSEIISYNITNNLETTISDLESSISPPYRNIISSDDNLAFEINQETYVGKPQTIFGSDDRIRVTPTTSYPWRSI
ncbi:MAG: hypothetical protein HWN67_23315, partial [Candidatus Helarchaeota archaeon]|nr:hypothetical protein [Candidatus Helarchaeota archaeon]